MTNKIIICTLLSLLSFTNMNADDNIMETLNRQDIPLLNIVTKDGVMPTCTVVLPPEGCFGRSINAEYVEGHLTMTLKGNTLYDSGDYVKGVSGMRIKIRGNTTGAALAQHPYKIKLSKKEDLLMRGDKKYNDKNWVLLSMSTWNTAMEQEESNILNLVGHVVSRTVGMDWTPEVKFVNVIMNGVYQGMYYMSESVEKSKGRVNVDATGYLVENDAYWWKEGESYFKTDNQPYYFGWTWKYPDADDVDEPMKQNIQQYINNFENALYHDGDISEYIDLESFAEWVLAHDILGSSDYAGSNMFFSKKDFNIENPTSTKLRMCVLWDFDSSFCCPEKEFSNQHNTLFYFQKLFKRDDFKRIYINLYKSLKPSLYNDIMKGLENIWITYSGIFDNNIAIHKQYFKNEGKNTFQGQINQCRERLEKRLNLLDNKVAQMETETGIKDNVFHNTNKRQVFDIYGRIQNNNCPLSKGIYLYKNADGKARKISRKQ